MLQADDLTKRFEDGVLAVDGLNLLVGSGEVYCLLGANGAGKTTTINLFLDFLKPTSGRALVDEVDVHKEPLLARSRIALLPERVRLYENLSARQNLEFFARLAGNRSLDREDLYRTLGYVGLEPNTFEKSVGKFSKGMTQKLGIAIAILKGATNLLLDEPTSGLDPTAAAEVVQLLQRLRRKNYTILMSTHDIFRVKDIASKIGIMNQGCLVAEKSREEFAHVDLLDFYSNAVLGPNV